MRVRLQKEKQKELIMQFKLKNNLSWNKLAHLLSVKVNRLLSYYHEECLIPELTYKILDQDKKYEKFILEKLADNWGLIKGGKNSKGNTKLN